MDGATHTTILRTCLHNKESSSATCQKWEDREALDQSFAGVSIYVQGVQQVEKGIRSVVRTYLRLWLVSLGIWRKQRRYFTLRVFLKLHIEEFWLAEVKKMDIPGWSKAERRKNEWACWMAIRKTWGWGEADSRTKHRRCAKNGCLPCLTADEDELQKTPRVVSMIVKVWAYSITNVKSLRIWGDDVITHIITER